MSFLPGLLGVLVPASYAWLIVTVIHHEALPGNRQFWLTRPYRLRSLVTAKALFILAFVSGSMVLKDVVIATANGFTVSNYIPALLLRQVAWTAWVVLPACAAAVITRNLQEIALLGGALALVYGLQGALLRTTFWPGIEWIRDYLGMILLLGACSAIVVGQYRRRETAHAGVMVACCSILVIVGLPRIPWDFGFTVQMLARRPQIDVQNAQIAPDLARRPRPQSALPVSQNPVLLGLPVRLSGFPQGLTVAADGVRISIQSNGRTVWHSGWQPYGGNTTADRYRFQVVYIDGNRYRQVRDQRVTVTLSLDLTLLENAPSIHVQAHQLSFNTQQSRCENLTPDAYPPAIWCTNAFQAQPPTLIGLEIPDNTQTVAGFGTRSYAPYESVLDLSPLHFEPMPILSPPNSPVPTRELWERRDARIVLTPQRPIAHFRRQLQFSNIRLADYVLPPPQFTIAE